MNHQAIPPLPSERPAPTRVSALWLLLLIPPAVCVVVAAWVLLREPPDERYYGPVDSTLTISEETTLVTAPLTSDGRVDYLAHLNAVMSEGVTPETNAAVPVFEVIGPAMMERDPDCAAQLADALGVDLATLEDVPKWLTWSVHEDEFQARRRRRGRLSSEEEQQRRSEWIAANADALAHVAAGLERPHYYYPIAWCPHQRRWATAIGRIGSPAMINGAFLSRADQRLAQGDAAGAWEDIRLAHQLTRYAERMPSLRRYVSNGALFRRYRSLLLTEELDVSLIRTMLADVRSLPPKASLADVLWIERLLVLNRLQGWAYGLEHNGTGTLASEPLSGVPWNDVFRQVNQDWDELEDVYCHSPDWASLQQDYATLPSKHQRAYPERPFTLTKSGDPLANAPHGRPRELLKMYAQAAHPLYYMRREKAADARSWYETVTNARLCETAVALRLYVARSGRSANSLDALVPDYMPAIPDDVLFGDGPIRYRRLADGRCLVYSVGLDGRDSRGPWYARGGGTIGEDPDDIVVFLPPP